VQAFQVELFRNCNAILEVHSQTKPKTFQFYTNPPFKVSKSYAWMFRKDIRTGTRNMSCIINWNSRIYGAWLELMVRSC